MVSRHSLCALLLTGATLVPGLPASAQEVLWQIEQEFGPTAKFFRVAAIGDVTGDGISDLLVGSRFGWIRVISGADGSNVYDIFGPDGEHGATMAGIGDFNGDGNLDFAVGNTHYDEVAGLVVVYSGHDGSVLASVFGPVMDQQTGYALSGLGDIDGDGYTDIAVGNVVGRVDIYRGPNATLLRTHQGPGTRPSVAGIGDVDGDGRPDYVIGWPQDSTGGLWAGTAKVFSGATGQVIHQVYGSIPHNPNGSPPTTGDHLGRAVAAVGDLDGDGVPDFACGAPGEIEPNWLNRQSRVLVFSGVDASLLLEIDGKRDSSFNGWFGGAIASAGDINGDGIPDLVIGAPSEAGPFLYPAGSVNVYSGRTGMRLWRTFAALGSNLGTYVAVLGDLTGDGLAEFASGDRTWNDWHGRILVWKGFRSDAWVACAAEANSVGPGAALEMGGSLGLESYGGFELVASGLPAGTPGLFFYGNPGADQAFGEGRLCVGAPQFRLGPPEFADSDGTLSRGLDFSAPPASSGPGAIGPGTTKTFQLWYRDPTGGPAGFNLSEALCATFGP